MYHDLAPATIVEKSKTCKKGNLMLKTPKLGINTQHTSRPTTTSYPKTTSSHKFISPIYHATRSATNPFPQ